MDYYTFAVAILVTSIASYTWGFYWRGHHEQKKRDNAAESRRVGYAAGLHNKAAAGCTLHDGKDSVVGEPAICVGKNASYAHDITTK